MITREQVETLRPGDVVSLTSSDWAPGTEFGGPLYEEDGLLCVGPAVIRYTNGDPTAVEMTLTVVSRAPRPLYVNHDRSEPHFNDVVRDADDDSPPTVWLRDSGGDWWTAHDGTVRMYEHEQLPKRLRLLVDGETGQVVP